MISPPEGGASSQGKEDKSVNNKRLREIKGHYLSDSIPNTKETLDNKGLTQSITIANPQPSTNPKTLSQITKTTTNSLECNKSHKNSKR